MDEDIERMVRGCKMCAEALPSQGRETLKPHIEPDRVFQHISMDLFSYGGREFMVIADVKSGWPTTFNMGRSVTAQAVIDVLRGFFCDTAVPTILYSDNGPQLDSNLFYRFMAQWGIQHLTSSPRYPQSNGHAEASVKAMKALVIKCWNQQTQSVDRDKWAHGLLQWRNTPRSAGLSPAQMVFGHPSRDALPVHKRAFAPEWQRAAREVDERAAHQKARLEGTYNRTARDLPPLPLGTPVAVQDSATKKWTRYGNIIEVGPHRDYFIRLTSGRVWRRNRRLIRRRYPVQPEHIDPGPIGGPHGPAIPPAAHQAQGRQAAANPMPANPVAIRPAPARPVIAGPRRAERQLVAQDRPPVAVDPPPRVPEAPPEAIVPLPLHMDNRLVPAPPPVGLDRTAVRWKTRRVRYPPQRLIEEDLD